MNEQEIAAALAFMNRVNLNAQEIPAWQTVVLRLQEMQRALQKETATFDAITNGFDTHSEVNSLR